MKQTNKKSFSLNYSNFTPEDHLYINAKDHIDAGRKLGQGMSVATKSVLKEKVSLFGKKYFRQCELLLLAVEQLVKKNIFTFDGINYLSRYADMLRGFCDGAGISLIEGVFLQSFADSGCQSIIVHDTRNHCINIVHTEENTEDSKLIDLQVFLEKKRANQTYSDSISRNAQRIRDAYQYKLVHMNIGDQSTIFFGYPGLCSGGPAFGVNSSENVLFVADTLMPVTKRKHHDMWANAVISMLFDAGSLQRIEKIFSASTNAHLAIFGGYAVHTVSFGNMPQTHSWEFGADVAVRQPTVKQPGRSIIAQTNLSLHRLMRNIDANDHPEHIQDRQLQTLLTRRTNQLCEIAIKDIIPTKNTREDIQQLKKVIASPLGDVEISDLGSVFVGFPSVYEAAYLVGSFSPDSASINIGKLTPPPVAGNEYALLFDPNNHKHQQSVMQIVQATQAHALSVAIVYSLASERSLKTPFGETDEDTSYVANNIMLALKKKGIEATLYPVGEHEIGKILNIRADCIINLIEWTGLDAQLKKETFDCYRKLNIPITGATEENILRTENKLSMKQLLDTYKLPTARWQGMETGNEPLRHKFVYPVIVKPAYEHCSVGLGYDSIAYNEKQLRVIAKKQIGSFKGPAIIEEFIKGRELLVYLLQNKESVRVLPIEEIVFVSNHPLPFQTYDSKWNKQSEDFRTTKVVLANLAPNDKKKIEQVSLTAFRQLGFRGYARFDIRLKNSVPYLLETNANPNMYDSDEEQIPGIEFPDFVETIINTAIYQHKKGWKI